MPVSVRVLNHWHDAKGQSCSNPSSLPQCFVGLLMDYSKVNVSDGGRAVRPSLGEKGVQWVRGPLISGVAAGSSLTE